MTSPCQTSKAQANGEQIETQQSNKYTQMAVIKTTLKCLLEKRVVQSNLEVSNEPERRFWAITKSYFIDTLDKRASRGSGVQ